jgi:hypothetical protein|tara:strand:+ start:14596 stop:14820 length:225 start_codon:yes stop_codon:yes gene_type:complete
MNVTTNPKHYEAFKWCDENNIKIYPKPRKNKFILVYSVNGFAKTSGKEYDKDEYMQAIWDFYIFLYDKLKNVSN